MDDAPWKRTVILGVISSDATAADWHCNAVVTVNIAMIASQKRRIKACKSSDTARTAIGRLTVHRVNAANCRLRRFFSEI